MIADLHTKPSFSVHSRLNLTRLGGLVHVFRQLAVKRCSIEQLLLMTPMLYSEKKKDLV